MGCQRCSVPVVLCCLLASWACGLSVNSPIEIADGETRRGDLTTVNGEITIGNDCTIEGSCRSVNGGIEVGRNSRVETLQAVNGSIDIGADTVVGGDVESVNGRIRSDPGAEIAGKVSTINGSIELSRTTVDRITTVNGDILLEDGSVVEGDIVVEHKMGSDLRNRPLEIELSGGSVVKGDVRVEHRETEVNLVLRDESQVLGQVENAEIIER